MPFADPVPVRDLYLRGEYTDSEKDKVVEGLVGLQGAIVTPADAPDTLRDHAAYRCGRQAMACFAETFDAPANWKVIDPRVRVIAYFARVRFRNVALNAAAYSLAKFLDSELPTFAIHVNVDGLEPLRQRAAGIVELAFPDEMRDLLLVREGAATDPEIVDRCATVAVFWMLLHEMGHVLRGHLDLVEASSYSEVPGADSTDPLTSRALELDADTFAAGFLGHWLSTVAGTSAGGAPRMDLFFLGLIASHVVMSALAQDDPSPRPRYHSPLVRLAPIVQVLGRSMGCNRDDVLRLFKAYLAVMWDADKTSNLLSVYERDAVYYRIDSDSLPKTQAKRADLLHDGRLAGWILTEE